MLTLTKSPGTGGEIKKQAEDFVVKEITARGIVLKPDTSYTPAALGIEESRGGKHIAIVLQKRDWNTVDALAAIAKKLGHGRKSISYAGSKDKRAVTVQLAAVFHPSDYDMGAISIKDIKINGFWRSDEIKLGDSVGNAFDARIRNASAAQNAEKTAGELQGRMPNYFGEQRFGSRSNNARIGAAILRGNFEEAVMDYLTSTENERNEEVKAARDELKETRDFDAAARNFPKFLRGELKALAYLSRYPKNYANALKMLPRGIAMMFIHGLQSEIFNEELEIRIKEKDFESPVKAKMDFYGFPDAENCGPQGDFAAIPIIGYETKDEELSGYAKDLMARMRISKEDFRAKGIPELAMKGSHRVLLSPVRGLFHRAEQDDLLLSFSLPKGTYATVLLEEFIKSPSGSPD